MTSPFHIREHVFEGQHIRGYRGALAKHPEDVLRLHAKCYIPHEVATGATSGDLTIVAFHANAFHKEVYEPFFEHLYEALKLKHQLTIGGIYIADQANQGSSALLNADSVGTEVHWFDHARDVLQMVNTLRQEMHRPIVAVGHSMGGTQAVATAHFHPQLFEAVILIDPPITLQYAPSLFGMFQYALRKPELFQSRADAEKFVRSSPFFKSWDSKVLDRYIETAFHTGSTPKHPNDSVKTVTPSDAEIGGLVRPNHRHLGIHQDLTKEQRRDFSDIDPDAPLTGPVYNPFSRQGYSWLPSLHPAALFLLGQGSRICSPKELDDRTQITGTAVGGSGGIKSGAVKSITIRGGHFLPMTNPVETGEAIAGWVAERVQIWREAEAEFMTAQSSREEQHRIDPDFMDTMKRWDGKPWHNPRAKADGGRGKL